MRGAGVTNPTAVVLMVIDAESAIGGGGIATITRRCASRAIGTVASTVLGDCTELTNGRIGLVVIVAVEACY